MPRTQVFEIPGKLKVQWDSDAKAIIDTWTSYALTKEEFAEAVLKKGLAHATLNGGRAYIVDSSNATGTFSQEIQQLIGTDIFPAFAKGGIRFFITILSKSAITNLGIKSYSSKTGPHGLQLVEVASLDVAIRWLKENAP